MMIRRMMHNVQATLVVGLLTLGAQAAFAQSALLVGSAIQGKAL